MPEEKGGQRCRNKRQENMEETLLEFRRKTEAYRTMNAELEILGVKLKHYRVDAAMEIAEEYLSNDKLNTIGIVTMQMLMQASKEPTWKQYIEDLDLTLRSYNCLKRSDIHTLGDIIRIPADELAKIRNFGKKSYAEVEEKVLTFGLELNHSQE